jgi:catechol 2,3-dioxygenase-like lactoylglutathione lyase family enzyme
MNQPILNRQQFCQVALVVHDIEHARQTYAKVLACEPPPVIITDPAEKSHIQYRGATTPARAKLAFFSLGNVQLELIEPIDGPSIWREHLDRHGAGIHHIAFRVADMQQTTDALAERGCPTVQTGDFTGGCYAYVDSAPQLGVMLELLQVTNAK